MEQQSWPKVPAGLSPAPGLLQGICLGFSKQTPQLCPGQIGPLKGLA